MRIQSFSPMGRARNVVAIVTAAVAFALPSLVQLGAQAAAPAKPAAQAAVTKPAAAQPAAKPGTAQKSTAKPAAQPATTKAPPAAAAAAKAAPAAAAKPQVDINHATVKELKTIPGIGDAYAAKIVAGRPYANKSQLVSRKVIAASLYETIQGMIIAKQ